ncbi:MAG: zeta toxin family protein [Planctomycetes bacterium]|jgi:predicted ABC-type ATPase|nr:zeta toxin family protein [Planctomycetota bacterium]
MSHQPRVCVLGGPNGAGKTTSAAPLVRDELGISTFVNADTIAHGLSAFDPAAAAVAAGRIMLEQMRGLAAARVDFAFETTLASRSFAPWLRKLRQQGYELLLVFVWLPSAELSIARVADRVRAGGHDVPEPTIRRRYPRGIANFVRIYRPLVDHFWCYDNSEARARLVADGSGDSLHQVQPMIWQLILRCSTTTTA